MALGDVQDMARRLRALLPTSWFPDDAPVLSALLTGLGAAWEAGYAQVAYVRRQLRLATATGDNLDVIALDYLGDRISRRDGETDDRFRARVKLEVLRPRVTRQALSDRLEELTGRKPVIFEPGRAADTGAWNTGGLAFGAAGGWGSRRTPYQCFVVAYRPHGEGVPLASGFNESAGGFGEGRLEFLGPNDVALGVTDADIRAAVVDTVSAGTVVWLAIQAPPTDGVRYDQDGVWDVSRWG